MTIVDCAPRQRCGTCGKFLERGKGCPVHDPEPVLPIQIQKTLEGLDAFRKSFKKAFPEFR